MGTTESRNERTVISDSKGKVQNGKNKLVQLYNELNDLDTALGRDPQRIVSQRKREHVKLKLELLEQHKARPAQVRARANWIEMGEKNTKFFLHLDKRQDHGLQKKKKKKNAGGQSVFRQRDIFFWFREIILLIYISRK